MESEVCGWCGVGVDEDSGFRAIEPAGERRAAFCRLEHIVPWVIQGAHWDVADPEALEALSDAGLGRCAHCAAAVDERVVLLIRHRGEHRIGDAFCGPDHLLEWAKRGGRWQT